MANVNRDNSIACKKRNTVEWNIGLTSWIQGVGQTPRDAFRCWPLLASHLTKMELPTKHWRDTAFEDMIPRAIWWCLWIDMYLAVDNHAWKTKSARFMKPLRKSWHMQAFSYPICLYGQSFIVCFTVSWFLNGHFLRTVSTIVDYAHSELTWSKRMQCLVHATLQKLEARFS